MVRQIIYSTRELLLQAEKAYHDLLLGQSPRVFVDQNGERVEYGPANRQALAAYISDLRRALAGAGDKPKHYKTATSKGV